ncbi:uncharacterized protein BT62DRAFT_1014322 [Guyanagaster necrorhizus]|uniref:Uncharacterized protein n=1 Tax=Guyanagaster necrorhizus TaxID=856835 RepID=A0A9P8AKX5_9AGAR|nr:uncharacterized protein BT62DRAFT_1014322 [Guyanagaster necrorhizus MCA 3950]KAG7439129.1 hypothetical protein BT62DRAFT_1014322 [Guyanagaster necrorhizus MCA 3950]
MFIFRNGTYGEIMEYMPQLDDFFSRDKLACRRVFERGDDPPFELWYPKNQMCLAMDPDSVNNTIVSLTGSREPTKLWYGPVVGLILEKDTYQKKLRDNAFSRKLYSFDDDGPSQWWSPKVFDPTSPLLGFHISSSLDICPHNPHAICWTERAKVESSILTNRANIRVGICSSYSSVYPLSNTSWDAYALPSPGFASQLWTNCTCPYSPPSLLSAGTMEQCVVIEWCQAVQQSEAGQTRRDDKENIASGLSLRVFASESSDYSRSNNGLLVNLDLIYDLSSLHKKEG